MDNATVALDVLFHGVQIRVVIGFKRWQHQHQIRFDVKFKQGLFQFLLRLDEGGSAVLLHHIGDDHHRLHFLFLRLHPLAQFVAVKKTLGDDVHQRLNGVFLLFSTTDIRNEAIQSVAEESDVANEAVVELSETLAQIRKHFDFVVLQPSLDFGHVADQIV